MIGKLHFSSSLAAVAFCTAERERGGGPIECYLTAHEGENASPAQASPHCTGLGEHLWPESLPHAGLTITKLHEPTVQELLGSENERTQSPKRESPCP